MVDPPGLEPVCLNVFLQQNAFNIYRAGYGPLRLRGLEQLVFYAYKLSFIIVWKYEEGRKYNK